MLKFVPVKDKIKHDADVAPKYIPKCCHVFSLTLFFSTENTALQLEQLPLERQRDKLYYEI